MFPGIRKHFLLEQGGFDYNSGSSEVSYMDIKTGTVLSGFRVNRIREIPDCAGVLYEMEHEQTGAQLCWMKRQDENKDRKSVV